MDDGKGRIAYYVQTVPARTLKEEFLMKNYVQENSTGFLIWAEKLHHCK